jgi:DNA-binding NtrC family response regulator
MERAILIVDDEKKLAHVLAAALSDEGYAADTAFDGAQALARLAQRDYFLVITDLKLPDIDGLAVLQAAREKKPAAEVMLMTAFASAQTAVAAMKAGAYEYIIKPFEMDELLLKVRHISDRLQLAEENVRLKAEIARTVSFESMLGKSKKMHDVFTLIEKVAERDVTVLVRGESGTGKEMVARAVHNRSQRRDEPFLAVNCGALPETLLESELFGYEKGAFTGAAKQKPGYLETAGAGTIFLDEIGDITPAIQVKLLRVLETRQVTRLGGTQAATLKARIVAATNRDLEEAIKENRFREDLYYRLNIFPIVLPPLRDRKEDLPELIRHFLKGQSIEPKAMEILLAYRWPGNVRELANILERASILAGDAAITVDLLPAQLSHKFDTKLSLEIPDEGIVLEEVEKKLVYMALDKARGNKSKAAQLLGITRRMLYSKLDRYEGRGDDQTQDGEKE